MSSKKIVDDDLGNKLSEFAEELIAEVHGEPTEVRVMAFKAISAFYISRTKLGKMAAEDDGDTGIPAMRERLKLATSGDK